MEIQVKAIEQYFYMELIMLHKVLRNVFEACVMKSLASYCDETCILLFNSMFTYSRADTDVVPFLFYFLSSKQQSTDNQQDSEVE